MEVNVLKTPQEKSRGVIGREPETFDEVFLFSGMYGGDSFHMRGVKGALDFVFLDKEFGVISVLRSVVPETGSATTPPNACYVVEMKAGGVDHYELNEGTPWVALTNYVLNSRKGE